MNITTTEFENRLPHYLNIADSSPVIMKDSGNSADSDEDLYWIQRAKQAESEGYMGEQALNTLLSKHETVA
jgi:hypothetical protein